MTYLKRDISHALRSAVADMPVVVLTGMRQTGKSTFLRSEPEFKNWKYVTFDDLAQLTAAKEDPEGFVGIGAPLIIDEAQRFPDIFVAIKRLVDKKRMPGRFLLSGSANFLLLKHIAESLAGRAAYFTLHPFTRREIEMSTENEPFLKTFFKNQLLPRSRSFIPLVQDEIVKGGMPPVCLDLVKNRTLWFKGYEQTYLERDIRDLSRLGNIISFRNLLHLAAYRTATILSVSQLGRDARLSNATTTNYLSILEASHVTYRLAPYLKNKASRLVKSPKLYFGDSGLACHLAGIDNLSTNPFRGALLETYVAQNIMSILHATWQEADAYFWNVQGRNEVDFVIEAGEKCMVVEVKATARWGSADLAGLKSFIASTPRCIAGILAYNGTEPVKVGEKIWAIPITMLLG
ncbi:MAG: ATP-binding protein [Nitrospirae bacterium]|nr:ATP-binding protein [Nitrospirota bacterium]